MKPDHVDERRQFISDAFHTLNQPLTGLHCGLEITLQKPRTEGEYRQRIGDAVENAGTILALIRSIRQLVDAADPGERFGTLSLSAVLSQLSSELEVVSEATGVALGMDCGRDVPLLADPAKLTSALGLLIAAEMESRQKGASVKVVAKPGKSEVLLTIGTEGTLISPPANGKAAKLAEIRRSAAISYLWTIGGDFEATAKGMTIKLPLAR